MTNSRSRNLVSTVPNLWVLFVVTILLLGQKSVVRVSGDDKGVSDPNGGVEDGRSQFCSLDLATFLPPPYGNLSYSTCHPVWETFVLRVRHLFLLTKCDCILYVIQFIQGILSFIT